MESPHKDDKISAGIDQHSLDRLLDILGISPFKLNLDTRDINITPNTAKLTGFVISDLPNNKQTKDSLIYKEDRALVNKSIASVVNGERSHYHIKYRMVRRDSSIIWLEEAGLISEYTEDGRPLFLSAIALDQSQLKWAEEKAYNRELGVKRLAQSIENESLAEENRLLRAANEAGSMLIGGFHQDYHTLLQQSLKMLGESVQADYASIWRNQEREGKMFCHMRARWMSGAHDVADENRSAYYVKDALLPDTEFDYDTILPGWQKHLAENKYLLLDSGKLPGELMQDSGMEKAQSLALLPIYMHGEFWGMFGLARDTNLPFTQVEAETMLAGVMVIAGSISRSETFGKMSIAREKALADTMAKGTFLSRMSHEMRTPLNAIIGMTEIAAREKNPHKIKEYISKINASSEQLLSVINDVLDISKIEAGKLKINSEPFDFSTMLQRTIDIARVAMDEKQQFFSLTYEEAPQYEIISDEHRLSQVILNLLGNATKFTPERGAISVLVKCLPRPHKRARLYVEVQDTGIGISPQEKEKVFKPFEQADGSITRKFGGTGLGLVISKEILHALGGNIWVDSKPEQGSRFIFELEVDLSNTPAQAPRSNTKQAKTQKPCDQSIKDRQNVWQNAPSIQVKQSSRESLSNTSYSHKNTKGVANWHGRTILLVEDVEINREIVQIMLEDTGVELVQAKDGKEGLERFVVDMEKIDLVLMDMQMPVLDGISATKQIREMDAPHAKQVPIIAMTANTFNEDVVACIKAGMNEHLAKPISKDLFLRTLSKYLD